MSMSHGTGGAGSQDFELNLASIIDCFTVLITFMLVSASFLSIGILDAGIAAAGATAVPTTPPPIQIAVELRKDQSAAVKVTGKTTLNKVVPAKDAIIDQATITEVLAGVTKQYPDVKAVTLSAENQVDYQSVIRTMDSVRKTLPVVVLGGF
jgi:biopolymer transport protein ExbD